MLGKSKITNKQKFLFGAHFQSAEKHPKTTPSQEANVELKNIKYECLKKSGYGTTPAGYESVANSGYRYGFQGQEKDDEWKGSGNSINYKYRVHDPRIGRFLSVDPLAAKYPSMSPYNFVGNMPIAAIDPDGKQIKFVNAESRKSFYNTVGKTLGSDITNSLVSARNDFYTNSLTKNSRKAFIKGVKAQLKGIDDKEVKSQMLNTATALFDAITNDNTTFVEVISPTKVVVSENGLSINWKETDANTQGKPGGDKYRIGTQNNKGGAETSEFDISDYNQDESTNTFTNKNNEGLVITTGDKKELNNNEGDGLLEGVINTDQQLSDKKNEKH